jgi:hypothetical protein
LSRRTRNLESTRRWRRRRGPRRRGAARPLDAHVCTDRACSSSRCRLYVAPSLVSSSGGPLERRPRSGREQEELRAGPVREKRVGPGQVTASLGDRAAHHSCGSSCPRRGPDRGQLHGGKAGATPLRVPLGGRTSADLGRLPHRRNGRQATHRRALPSAGRATNAAAPGTTAATVGDMARSFRPLPRRGAARHLAPLAAVYPGLLLCATSESLEIVE